MSLLLPLLAACFIELDEDSFGDRFAAVACERLEECYYAQFEASYDADAAACEEQLSDSFAEYSDEYGCSFDEDDAADCLDDTRSAACEDLFGSNASTIGSCERVCR